ncbi:10371_t:CDS:1 [Racocetra fulgida]|uniref:10371_t:CDS:1 n=1 Tax=Racocetra fulgida TaxID=60492 RepID=A0A9N8VKM4_9GLOM|nr:10371_t:CDS:1 [Racocetra fulgida]
MSESEIKDQIVEFLIAGSDINAFAILMAIIMLLKHPDKLRKLRTELESTFPEFQNRVKSREHENNLFLPSYESLKHLKYLGAVVDETLRLYPSSLGGIARQTTEDTIISNYLIPKGTMVSASIWNLHRSKQFWGPDADEFVPERWFNLDANIRSDAYFPFGSGPRLCIGNNFATMEIKIIVCALLGNFEFFFTERSDYQVVQIVIPSLKNNTFEVGVTRL